MLPTAWETGASSVLVEPTTTGCVAGVVTASPLSVTAAPAGVAPSDTSTVRGARSAVFTSVWPLE